MNARPKINPDRAETGIWERMVYMESEFYINGDPSIVSKIRLSLAGRLRVSEVYAPGDLNMVAMDPKTADELVAACERDGVECKLV